MIEGEYKRLYLLLKAVRNINRVITTDFTIPQLVIEVTSQLKNTKYYTASWIVLFKNNMKVIAFGNAGFGGKFNDFMTDIKKGKYSPCIKKAFSSDNVEIIQKSFAICRECALMNIEPNGSLLTVPIKYRGIHYGVYSVVVPENFTFIEEEKISLMDLASDIGLALNNYYIVEKYKTAVALMQKNELKYREFFNNDISANVIAKPDGKIIDCNSSFIKLFGLKTKKEALKMNAKSFYIDTADRSKFLKFIKEKKKLKNQKIKYKKKTGDIITVLENATGIFDKDNNLERLLIHFQDITEEEKLKNELIQSKKMESLGRVAGGIAHDLNNMLVPIKGYVDLLLLETNEKNPIYSKLQEINKASDKAIELIRGILAFSKKQILNIEIFDINEEIRRFDNILKQLIGENIKFNIVLSSEALKINGDKTQIDQILINLASNARDAMPKGGTLTIETSGLYLDNLYRNKHINIKPGNYVLLSISDDGIGMDNRTLNMIFEPFFTTKTKGTGLGLSTVYGIVKQHNGYIIVYSEPGYGTTFKIYFPLSKKKVKKSALSPKKDDEIGGGNEKILLVEDEKDVRKVIKEILTQYGYTVYDVGSPTEAINLVKNDKLLFDLLITDIILPEMDGKELYNTLSNKIGKFKVLYMSGYTSNVISHGKILDKGVYFIHKPFSVNALLAKTREVLESI